MSVTKELRFECVRCGKCCIDKNTIVNITYFDIIRLYTKLKLNIDELIHILGFYIFKQSLSKEFLSKMVISPVNTEKGSAFVGLRKLENHHCFFFNDKNKECKIHNIRPDICRAFPFSFFNNKNQEINIIYTEKGKQYCVGINENSPIINEHKLKDFANKFLNVLKKNEDIIKDWNNNISKIKQKSSVRNFLKYLLDLEL
ncbi:MAG: YkgJ family cysteine cluster protein [Candidatus Lokiarchaeota archaeon]|nr:YkgJ family cysteine cluster protein [Candidatus Lokiarchaeota archaeon]